MRVTSQPATGSTRGACPPRVLCARYPHLGLVAALRRFAELRGEAVIVSGAPELRLPVIAASRAALADGVRAGQPLRQAQQLCPRAAFVALDREGVEEQRGALSAALQSLSPVVEVGDEEALCDLSGRHAAYADESAWAVAVARALHAVLEVEPPALGLAGSRFVARMAAQVCDAGRIRRVRAGEEPSFLAPLPLDVLPANPSTTTRLAAFGLDCLGAVAALSPADLQRQFGSEGLYLHRLARGQDGESVHALPARSSRAERLVLEGATGDLETLLHAVRHCASLLAERLSEGGMAAAEASVTLEPEEADPVAATIRPALPITDGAGLWMAALSAMSELTPPAPVAAVSVSLSNLQAAAGRQSDLLRAGDAARENVAAAAGRLQARFGSETVRRPVLAVDPGDMPERRFAWRIALPAAAQQ
jgi:nucleotidyltransferase/DNA polymerase involved in DNA repair